VAYHVIKRVKGRSYLYLQESFREGGGVRTRSKYIGAVDPDTGELSETSLSDSELVNLFRREIRDRVLIAGDPGEWGKVWEIAPRRGKSPFAEEARRLRAGGEHCRLSFQIDCERFAISRYSLEEDEERSRKRLARLGIGVDPTVVSPGAIWGRRWRFVAVFCRRSQCPVEGGSVDLEDLRHRADRVPFVEQPSGERYLLAR